MKGFRNLFGNKSKTQSLDTIASPNNPLNPYDLPPAKLAFNSLLEKDFKSTPSDNPFDEPSLATPNGIVASIKKSSNQKRVAILAAMAETQRIDLPYKISEEIKRMVDESSVEEIKQFVQSSDKKNRDEVYRVLDLHNNEPKMRHYLKIASDIERMEIYIATSKNPTTLLFYVNNIDTNPEALTKHLTENITESQRINIAMAIAVEEFNQKFPLLKHYSLITESLESKNSNNKLLKALNTRFDMLVTQNDPMSGDCFRSQVYDLRENCAKNPDDNEKKEVLAIVEEEYSAYKEALFKNNAILAKTLSEDQRETALIDAGAILLRYNKLQEDEKAKIIVAIKNFDPAQKQDLRNKIKKFGKSDFSLVGTEMKYDLLSASILSGASKSAIEFLMYDSGIVVEEKHIDLLVQDTVNSDVKSFLSPTKVDTKPIANKLMDEVAKGDKAEARIVSDLLNQNYHNLTSIIENFKQSSNDLIDLSFKNKCPAEVIQILLQKNITPKSPVETRTLYADSYGREEMAKLMLENYKEIVIPVRSLFERDLEIAREDQFILEQKRSKQEAKEQEYIELVENLKSFLEEWRLPSLEGPDSDRTEKLKVFFGDKTAVNLLKEQILYDFVNKVLLEGSESDIRTFRRSGYFDLITEVSKDSGYIDSKILTIVNKAYKLAISVKNTDKISQLQVIHHLLTGNISLLNQQQFSESRELYRMATDTIGEVIKERTDSMSAKKESQELAIINQIKEELQKGVVADIGIIQNLLSQDTFLLALESGKGSDLAIQCLDSACSFELLKLILEKTPKLHTAQEINDKYSSRYSGQALQELEFLEILTHFENYSDIKNDVESQKNSLVLDVEIKDAGEKLLISKEIETLQEKLSEPLNPIIDRKSMLAINKLLDKKTTRIPGSSNQPKPLLDRNNIDALKLFKIAIESCNFEMAGRFISCGFTENIEQHSSLAISLLTLVSKSEHKTKPDRQLIIQALNDKLTGTDTDTTKTTLALVNSIIAIDQPKNSPMPSGRGQLSAADGIVRGS